MPRTKPANLNKNADGSVRFDVLIYERKTGLVDAIVGTDLLSEDDPRHGFHTAEKRVYTVSERINDAFGVVMVPAGRYKKGFIVNKGDL